MTNTISLAVFTVLLAIGQILFKQAGLSMRSQPLLEGFLHVARQPWLYAALVLYGFATILWVWILSRVPLTQAYPWVAAGVVIVPLLAIQIFDEKVSPIFWVGAALIAAGIIITQYAVKEI